ncbi:MAG: hypothetical protein II799_07030 [Lachnospiraceae bacterium]|nr:hypothetical protein [Lachnospiraceae bacterium]
MSESGLFRKKSLDKISSPEKLNDYISVTNPGIWLLLVGIAVVLIGAVIWGFFGKLETRIKVPAIVGDEGTMLYVEASEISKIRGGLEVEIDETEGKVISLGLNGSKAYEVLGDLALTESGYSPGDVLYEVEAEIDLPNGIYMAEIITDSVSPMSFLLDNNEK